jgi:hypothetical protein
MKIFEEKLLRLKQEVKLTEDQEVAALLGLSKAAFADRKKRDAFPDEKLWALAQKRPDLKIDVLAVLTGISSKGHAQIALDEQASKLLPDDANDLPSIKKSKAQIKSTMGFRSETAREALLLESFRQANDQGKSLIEATAKMAASSKK